MSTRSNVIIKVKPEDIGKTIKFDRKKLPVKMEKWDEGRAKELSKPVTLEKQYIGIYCHWDGYPEGVGKTLLEKFSDYDTLLNLVAGGFCSVISDDGVRRYGNRSGEEWEYIQPKQSDTIEVAGGWTEYAYIFDEDDFWKMGIVHSEKNSDGEYDDFIIDIVDFDEEIVEKGHPKYRD